MPAGPIPPWVAPCYGSWLGGHVCWGLELGRGEEGRHGPPACCGGALVAEDQAQWPRKPASPASGFSLLLWKGCPGKDYRGAFRVQLWYGQAQPNHMAATVSFTESPLLTRKGGDEQGPQLGVLGKTSGCLASLQSCWAGGGSRPAASRESSSPAAASVQGGCTPASAFQVWPCVEAAGPDS